MFAVNSLFSYLFSKSNHRGTRNPRRYRAYPFLKASPIGLPPAGEAKRRSIPVLPRKRIPGRRGAGSPLACLSALLSRLSLSCAGVLKRALQLPALSRGAAVRAADSARSANMAGEDPAAGSFPGVLSGLSAHHGACPRLFQAHTRSQCAIHELQTHPCPGGIAAAVHEHGPGGKC